MPNIPFVVLIAGDRSQHMPPVFSEEAMEKIAELGIEMHKKMVTLIPGGKYIIVEGAGHNIHIEKSDALIGPVIDMISNARNK